jgi:hypothetical protein
VRAYRALSLPGRATLSGRHQVLDCADDEEAVNKAQQLVDRCNVEVRDRERFIA